MEREEKCVHITTRIREKMSSQWSSHMLKCDETFFFPIRHLEVDFGKGLSAKKVEVCEHLSKYFQGIFSGSRSLSFRKTFLPPPEKKLFSCHQEKRVCVRACVRACWERKKNVPSHFGKGRTAQT